MADRVVFMTGLACEKVPYGLSRCYTKRRIGMRGLLFGIEFFFFFVEKSVSCHTKRRMDATTRTRPSFGMTLTQAIIGYLFV